MIDLIWIFSISAVLIVGMISYRKYEIVSGEEIFSAEKRLKSDLFILTKTKIVFGFLEVFFSRLLNLFKDVPNVLHRLLHRIWRYFSSSVDRYFDKFRHHREGGKKGSISLYWQNLDSDKGE